MEIALQDLAGGADQRRLRDGDLVTVATALDLHVDAGEVLAICGDNGAGKSSLIRVVSGAHEPDDGTIEIEGKAQRRGSPQGALRAGIATIYLTVALALTGMGGFRLAREEGLPWSLATLVALVTALNGWNIAWALNWTPAIMGFMGLVWSWWALAGALRPGAGPGRTLLAGVMIAVLITGGWPHSIFAALVVTAWLGARAACRCERTGASPASLSVSPRKAACSSGRLRFRSIRRCAAG
jgi:energy-coupling factor transporter ATP-binding protein EcfA2